MSGSPTTLYRLIGADGALLYVGIAGNPGRRFEQHADSKPWWSLVAVARLEHHRSREAALEAERAAIEAERPLFNVAHNAGAEPESFAPCPCCGEPSAYVPHGDVFVHLDGSDNRRCWLRLVRCEVPCVVERPERFVSAWQPQRTAACPACDEAAVWVPLAGRWFHFWGADNRACWASLGRAA